VAAHRPTTRFSSRPAPAAERHYEEAVPVTSFPYPPKEKVLFYLSTCEGVRAISADGEPTYSGTGKHSALFGAGQSVVTELRKAAEQKR